MKKLVSALCATVALSMLGACAMDYAGPMHHHHDGESMYVDAYYDDAYGPYNDGYWANDGYFYYRDSADHPYKRDDAKHFRRDMSGGFHQVRAHSKAPDGEGMHGDMKHDHQ